MVRIKGMRLAKPQHWMLFLCAIALLAGGTHAMAESRTNWSNPKSHASREEFPLWIDVPTRNFAVLESGEISNRRWGLYLYRQGERSDQACVELGTLYVAGRGGHFQSGSNCGRPGSLEQTAVVVSSALSIRDGKKSATRSTVVGVLTAPDVARISVALGGGAIWKGGVQGLGKRRARKAHVSPVGYAAFAIGETRCVRTVTGYDGSGNVMFRTPRRSCDA